MKKMLLRVWDFVNLIIANMKPELISVFISLSGSFFPYLLLIFYFTLYRSLEWYVWRGPWSAWWAKACRSREKILKKPALGLNLEIICLTVNVLLWFMKDSWPFQCYISCSDENGIWNIVVKTGLIGVIMTKRMSMQTNQTGPNCDEEARHSTSCIISAFV